MYFIAWRESFAGVHFHAFGCLGTPLDIKKTIKNIVTHGIFLVKEKVLVHVQLLIGRGDKYNLLYSASWNMEWVSTLLVKVKRIEISAW